MPAFFSMELFWKYRDFKPTFTLISRKESENGSVVFEYESPSPLKGHKFHLRRVVDGLGDRGRYSFI